MDAAGLDAAPEVGNFFSGERASAPLSRRLREDL
jgi:hypothetical protein